MLLTERDIKIIEWIDSHGYVTAQQVFTQFHLNPKRGYRRLHLLVESGYILYKRIFFGKPGVYQAAGKGLALVAEDPERPQCLATVRPATMEHNLLLVDLAQALVRKTGGRWKTDRQVRRERGFEISTSTRPHIPDGVLTLPDGSKVAVELELTAKGLRRLEKILKGYARMTEYGEVWYFALTPALARRIRDLAQKMPFVKVFLLEEVLKNAGETELGAR